MYKTAIRAGAIIALIAVILGAFAAHILKGKLSPDQFSVFSTGIRFHFYHAFGLLITGILYRFYPYRSLKIATYFFIVGVILFCGSLYLMTTLSCIANIIGIHGFRIGLIGVITPIGGLCLVLGWVCVIVGISKTEVA